MVDPFARTQPAGRTLVGGSSAPGTTRAPRSIQEIGLPAPGAAKPARRKRGGPRKNAVERAEAALVKAKEKQHKHDAKAAAKGEKGSKSSGKKGPPKTYPFVMTYTIAGNAYEVHCRGIGAQNLIKQAQRFLPAASHASVSAVKSTGKTAPEGARKKRKKG